MLPYLGPYGLRLLFPIAPTGLGEFAVQQVETLDLFRISDRQLHYLHWEGPPLMTAIRWTMLTLAMTVITGCVYRPYPRPLPPESPGYVAPTYKPGSAAKAVRQ